MIKSATSECAFETRRLRAGPWLGLAEAFGLDLTSVVVETLTELTTQELPEAWRGAYSRSRAEKWIEERNRESPTCLVTDRRSERPVGLIIFFEQPLGPGIVDVRIGFVLAESAWGQGLASELVAGVVQWARSQPSVSTLTGGVSTSNLASARVLVKNGFRSIEVRGDEEIFQRHVGKASS